MNNLFSTFVVGAMSAVIASAATITVGLLGFWNTNRSHDIEMVRISLSILGGENKDSSIYGRKFALRVLEEYTVVDIPEDEFEAWAATGTIPDVDWAGWNVVELAKAVPTITSLSIAPQPGLTDQFNKRHGNPYPFPQDVIESSPLQSVPDHPLWNQD